jgi:molecular chaperone HtpG
LSTDTARDLLTPVDAAALAVSVALHDFGMHLTPDGFETLISDNSRWPGVSYFDDKQWSILWEEFFSEASRFDGRKLKALFGEDYRPVRPLPGKGQQWEDFDYLLVGEFLRRHHPRLAHDIALSGLPAKDGNAITICPVRTEEEQFLADICGLIARSHGMELRKCLSYLEARYSNRINPRRVHAAFLSVLLRISDYFQIQAQRAPTGRTEVFSFQSQISAREWKVHQCVSDIHNTGGDPEAIVIIAKPMDVETFLRLTDWLSGIQEELDRSWAILGEVYGLQKHNDLDQLGLKIRRVKSNLDDAINFDQGVPYVPARIAFEAANADLLKLLVAPLYNNDPGIGIRELLQNAIDAVREFDDYAAQRPEIASVERYDQAADVVLHIDCTLKACPLQSR